MVLFKYFGKVSKDNIAFCSDKSTLAAKRENHVRKQLKLLETSEPERKINIYGQYDEL